jgi:hypothetical protein
VGTWVKSEVEDGVCAGGRLVGEGDGGVEVDERSVSQATRITTAFHAFDVFRRILFQRLG